MSNLITNLRSAAAENFRLYPECYPIQRTSNLQSYEEADAYETGYAFLTNEADENLTLLSVGYGENDGFYAAGMSAEEVEAAVRAEFANFLRSE